MRSLTALRSIPLAALAAFALVACGSKDSGIAETWKGDGTAVSNPSAKAMAESMSLVLKKDQTFTASMGLPMEGSWSSAGNAVTLHLTKLGGSTLAELHKVGSQDKEATDAFDKPIVLERSADANTLTVTQVQTGPPDTPMVFKKQD